MPAALERSRSGNGGRSIHSIPQQASAAPPSTFLLQKAGMGKKQRRMSAEAMATVPDDESRVILATGSYIGEGFDDARLDTLFLAMPISWKGTLQQYFGRLHRLHDNERVVESMITSTLDPDAGKKVRAQIEGLQRNRLRNRPGD